MLTYQGADGLVKSTFLRGKVETDRAGLPWRQLDIDLAAGMADHHVAEQTAQLAAIFRQARIAAGHELFAEFTRGLELAWFKQGDQVVELV